MAGFTTRSIQNGPDKGLTHMSLGKDESLPKARRMAQRWQKFSAFVNKNCNRLQKLF